MKSPHVGFTQPDFSGQTKILFLNEGNPTSMLLTSKKNVRRAKSMTFADPGAALAWCRAGGVMMVYCPVALERN